MSLPKQQKMNIPDLTIGVSSPAVSSDRNPPERKILPRSNYLDVSRRRIKKVGVVGGAEFIGSHLCDALLTQGYEVFCIDDLTHEKEKNIHKLKSQKQFTLIKVDADYKGDFQKVGKLDSVFYVSGFDISVDNDASSLSSLNLNSEVLKYFLEKATSDQSEFLYLSLVDIYSGIASRLSLNNYFGGEKNEVFSSLLESKRFGEALVEEYRKTKGLRARIVRIRDVYGPKMFMDGPYLLNHLFKFFLQNQKIILPGDGLQELFPTYISDVIYGLVKAMFSSETEGKVYYLVNLEKERIRNIAEKLVTYYK